MDPRLAPADGPAVGAVAGGPVAPPRQRWRLVLGRSVDAPRLGGRELVETWDAALEASGLPVHRPPGRNRGRIAFAAPLPAGMAAERELADVMLAERVPIWQMRQALLGCLPAGWTLVDLFDVWPGAPALAGRVTGADYRIELKGGDPDALRRAAAAVLDASALPRVRQKGGGDVAYDLRPLLEDVTVNDGAPGPRLRIRTRIHPELGSGRPDEVLAAVAERLGHSLDVRSVVRERLHVPGGDQA